MKAIAAPTTNERAAATVVTLPQPKSPRKRAAASAPKPAADPLLAMIERCARDPNMDMAKLNELLAMRQRMEAEDRARRFAEAMAAAQAEMAPIATDAVNKEAKAGGHRYASAAQLDRAIRPIYSRHGFAISFDTEPTAPLETTVRVVCYVSNSGHTRRFSLDMPADGKGPRGGDVMSRTHATASAITYAKRYLLGLVFNLVTDARVDDDGNAAGRTNGALAPDQVARIKKLAGEVRADVRRFCAYLRVPSIEAIPAARYEHAVAALESKRRVSA